MHCAALLLLLVGVKAALVPTNLWINHRQLIGSSPVVSPVVDSAPRFSWQLLPLGLPADQRAITQSAFQLLVTGPQNETLCDTGTVQSNSSHLVACPTLESILGNYSSTVLTWRVRSWCWLTQAAQPCEAGNTPGPWSRPATFATALTDSHGTASSLAWEGADWISSSQPSSAESIMLRASLSPLPLTPSAVLSVHLHWIGLGYGRIWVNGCPARLGEAVAASCNGSTTELAQLVAPGDAILGPWTVWTKRLLYRSSDITAPVVASLAGGADALPVVIGAIVSKGQYAGEWAASWSPVSHSTPPIVLRAVLAYRIRNGTVAFQPVQAADAIAASSPVTQADVYKGEKWDVSLSRPGFSAQNFVPAPADWKPAAPPEPAWASVLSKSTMRAHAFSPIRVGQTPRAPVTQWQNAGGSVTYDFGANYVGTFALTVTSASDQVTVSLGEQLRDADGTICTEQCPSGSGTVYYPFGGQQFALARAPSNSLFAPGFVYAGFRFATVSGAGSNATIVAHVVRSDVQAVADAGFFDAATMTLPGYQPSVDTVAGQPMAPMPVVQPAPAWFLNSFLQRSLRALASNMHSIMSDCPTRERVGWTGDAAATLRAAALRLDTASFHSKWAIDMVQSQGPDGSLPSTIPYAKHLPPVDPSWPTVFPRIAELFATVYRDEATAVGLFQPVVDYVDYLPTVQNCPSCESDGSPLLERDGLPLYNMNGDWMQFRPQWLGARFSGPFFGAANYIHDVRAAAMLADLAGNASTKARLVKVADDATTTFNSLFVVNASRGHTECDASEEARKGGRDLWLRCADGGTMTNITFVSWGTPSGSCSSLDWQANSSCDSATARGIVEKLCLDQTACFPQTSTDEFGDPCVGVIKTLAVVAQCNGVSPPAEVAGSHYGGGDGETAIALETGLVRPAERAGVEASLQWLVDARNQTVWSGFWGNSYVLDALGNAGLTSTALEVAKSASTPSFGAQALVANLTSLSENWSGSPDATNGNAAPTHNHHFMGGWAHWLVTRVAGLDPWGVAGDGGSGPRLGPSGAVAAREHASLGGAFAWRVGQLGNVSVAWRVVASGKLVIDATVPVGSAASIVVPVATEAQVVLESGQQVWPVGARTSTAAPGILGVSSMELDGDHQLAVILRVGSGTFAVTTEAI